METKDILTLIAIWAAIAGWFVNGWLNRRNEIAKKRFEYRMQALQSFLKVWFIIEKEKSPFTHPDFLKLLEETRTNFQLYGEDDEIRLYEEFIRSIEKKDLENANKALHKLVPLVRKKVRSELKFKND